MVTSVNIFNISNILYRMKRSLGHLLTGNHTQIMAGRNFCLSCLNLAACVNLSGSCNLAKTQFSVTGAISEIVLKFFFKYC